MAASFKPKGSTISKTLRCDKNIFSFTKKRSTKCGLHEQMHSQEPIADMVLLSNSNCRWKRRQTSFHCVHHWEGGIVPAALHQRGQWHKSRELHDENQYWPCLRWQFSGKQSIKAGTTANCWPTEASDRFAFSEQKCYSLSPHLRLLFLESWSSVTAISANLPGWYNCI